MGWSVSTKLPQCMATDREKPGQIYFRESFHPNDLEGACQGKISDILKTW